MATARVKNQKTRATHCCCRPLDRDALWWLWWLWWWWWWWLWCGLCASRECLANHVRACSELKWVSASALTPSAGLTSRQKTLRLSLRRQVPGVPQVQIPHPTPSRGKRLRGSQASPPTPSEDGRRNLFHRLGVECPWSGMLTGGTLTACFPG